MRVFFILAAGLLLTCTAAYTQPISLVDPVCIPRKGNGVLRVSISGSVAGQPPRLYFRKKGESPFYWVPLETEPNGRYWAVLPLVDSQNDEVEYYAAVVSVSGKLLIQSKMSFVRVQNDCRVELTHEERGAAETLVIGETASSQYNKKLLGFLCRGIRIRIEPQGVKRADEQCGPCGLTWLSPSLAAAGILSLAGAVEASPSRP
jgi:hypothetical protein